MGEAARMPAMIMTNAAAVIINRGPKDCLSVIREVIMLKIILDYQQKCIHNAQGFKRRIENCD
jgi:hypothetical protein